MIVRNDPPLYPALERFSDYAQARIKDGASVADVIEEGIQRYCQDGQFVRQLVVDAMRFAAMGAATGKGIAHASARVEDDPSDLSATSDDALAQLAHRQRGFQESKEMRVARLQARSRSELLRMIQEQPAGSNPIAQFFEMHPTTRVPVKLLTLTREELLAAADKREDEGEYARRRALLCRELAAKLAPNQRAHEVWKERDITRLEEKILKQSSPLAFKRSGVA